LGRMEIMDCLSAGWEKEMPMKRCENGERVNDRVVLQEGARPSLSLRYHEEGS